MLSNLSKDLDSFTKNGNLFSKVKCGLSSHTFHLVMLYRFGSVLAKIPCIGNILRVILEYFIRIVYASDISLRSKIGPGLLIVHGHDIVIGRDVRIGKRCKIFNGVTLGNKDTEVAIGQQPTIGDGVVIGTGAKLLGSIQIGDNVIVGANSVVVKSFPANVVIVGVPAKILKPLLTKGMVK